MVMARISTVKVLLGLRLDQLCGAAGAVTGPPTSLVRVRVPDSRHGAKVAMMRRITRWYGRRTRTNRFITNRSTGNYAARLDSEKTVATVSTVVSLVYFNEWAHFSPASFRFNEFYRCGRGYFREAKRRNGLAGRCLRSTKGRGRPMFRNGIH